MTVALPDVIEGPSNLCMRLVVPQDAEYIYDLRMDPTYNAYLSPVSGGVEAQAAWIERYKQDEAEGTQFYFIIQRKDGQTCGVVRLYDITAEEFTWGSWVLDANKPPKAALESAFLIYETAFQHLGLKRAWFQVMRENENTLAFHRRFGVNELGEDDVNFYFDYTDVQFKNDRPGFIEILQAGN